jgi:enoyl-CoA hydratase
VQYNNAAEVRQRFSVERAGMSYETILVERDGAIATLTLNRPSVLNALNILMIRELKEAIAELDADRSVRAIVLTGAGDRSFAAGADIGELSALDGPVAGAAMARSGQALTLALENARTPTIAAINGFALGGGCELALACDIRIASEKAKFGQPEVNLGILPGYGGTQRTARLLGRGMAMYLCLSGELIDAPEALRIGLVEKVVAPAELLGEARRIATVIASRAPLAVAAAKRAIDDAISLDLEPALEIEALHFGTLIGTKDFAEGTRAFLEKRAPSFTNS